MQIPPYQKDPLSLVALGGPAPVGASLSIGGSRLGSSLSLSPSPQLRAMCRSVGQFGDFNLIPTQNLNRYRLKTRGVLHAFLPIAEHLTAGMSLLVFPNLLGYGKQEFKVSTWRTVKGTQLTGLNKKG